MSKTVLDIGMVATRYRKNNSESLVPVGVARRYSDCMDVKLTRRRKLLSLIEQHGTTAALARAVGLSEKYLSQIVNEFQGARDRTPRQVGDRAARQIESALGFEHGWMDTPDTPSTSAETPSRDVQYVADSGMQNVYNHANTLPGNPAEARPWPFEPASEADYMALSDAGKRFVKGQLALAIDEAKALYGPASGKRTA